MRRWVLWFLPIMFFFSSCSSSSVIVNGVEEREANEIIVFLASRNIHAVKLASKVATGVAQSGPLTYSIVVEQKEMTEAMAILNQNGLPRKKGTNLLELFAKQGFMTTDKQETIRYQAGLEQQIGNTIRKIDGVIDADVQLSFPQESTSGSSTSSTPSRMTAAVYVKHQGIIDDPNSHLVSKIKRLVASSVNGLDINDVTVISDRSRFTDVVLGSSLESASMPPKDYVTVWSIVIAKSSLVKFRFLFFFLILGTTLSLVGLLWLLWKVYPALRKQGRLKELFTLMPIEEIADPSSKNE